jgi:AcrR family transcriptional regulator
MSSPRTTARRKPPAERRAEILSAASALALAEGLEQVTARRVSEALGVYPGLIHHYFRAADDLVAAAFAHAAGAEREQVYAHARAGADATERIRRLLTAWLDEARDGVSLLWLDAWQASRRRPALRAAVASQMDIDLAWLTGLISGGVESGEFDCADVIAAGMSILALIDGLSVQAAVRGTLDYGAVRDMVLVTSEQILGLAASTLASAASR